MRPLLVAICLSLPLGACATGSPRGLDREAAPTGLAAAPEADEPSTALPIGIGLMRDPDTLMISAALDFPLDSKLSVGPAVQFGHDDDVQILSPYLKLKYKLPGVFETDEERPALLPYLTAGVGAAYIDKRGSSGDTGLLLNGGAGFRFLTGEKYRLGTEALLHWMPDRVAGERAYFSWELVQIVFDF